jgi:hypothetical protein
VLPHQPTNHSMPGLAIDSCAIPTRRSRSSKSTNNEVALQPFIKDEDEDFGDDDYDDGTYKSRPQLPKPYVVMRSLADLISR